MNPPGNEQDCAIFLADRLVLSGFHVEITQFAPGRSSLIARLPGNARGPALCFSGHLDTVPFGSEPWTHDPLSGIVENGKIWGRGTTDMKSGIAAFVCACEHYAADRTIDNDILLLLSAGEETGCEGARHIAESAQRLGGVGAIVVAEPTSNRVLHGHKGACWIRAVAKGKTAHGSRPDLGINAIYRLARALCELEVYKFDELPHPLLGDPSLNVGTMLGGENVNSVPDHACAMIDMRTVWPDSAERIRHRLQSAIGADISLSTVLSVPSLATDVAHPWVCRVEELVENLTGQKPKPAAAPYFTDGSFLSQAFGSVPTILLGPGEPEMAHQRDEWCSVEKIGRVESWSSRPLSRAGRAKIARHVRSSPKLSA